MWNFIAKTDGGAEVVYEAKTKSIILHQIKKDYANYRINRLCTGLYELRVREIGEGRYDKETSYYLVDKNNEDALIKLNYYEMECCIDEDKCVPIIIFDAPTVQKFGLFKSSRTISPQEDSCYQSHIENTYFALLHNDSLIKTFQTEDEAIRAIKEYPSKVTPIEQGGYQLEAYYISRLGIGCITAQDILRKAINRLNIDWTDWIDIKSERKNNDKYLNVIETIKNMSKSISNEDICPSNKYLFADFGATILISKQNGEINDPSGFPIQDLIIKESNTKNEN